MPNYPLMLAEFAKKSDWDFHEGFDGGTIYTGTKGVMHRLLWPKTAPAARRGASRLSRAGTTDPPDPGLALR